MCRDIRNDFADDNEADAKIFAKVVASLGLREVSATQLLVSLIARVAVAVNMVGSWRRPQYLLKDITNIRDEVMSTNMPPVADELTLCLLQILPYPRRGKRGKSWAVGSRRRKTRSRC